MHFLGGPSLGNSRFGGDAREASLPPPSRLLHAGVLNYFAQGGAPGPSRSPPGRPGGPGALFSDRARASSVAPCHSAEEAACAGGKLGDLGVHGCGGPGGERGTAAARRLTAAWSMSASGLWVEGGRYSA